jgi:hypothetical protein
VILGFLGAEGAEFGCGFLLVGRDEGEAGAAEDVKAEVAASFDPFVVLFGEDRADEPEQGAGRGRCPRRRRGGGSLD